MAKTVIVKLNDDLDGSDADETVRFALDGKTYEIDLSASNASKLRGALRPYIEKARADGGGGRTRPPGTGSAHAQKTLYSRLSDNEKARFRVWANMATARRISDARVKSWVAAGKP
jgi:Lsr2 protein